MAQPQRDDWEKPRSKGQHLTETEIGKLRDGYRIGRQSRDVARELRCSSRVASKYYGFFAAEGMKRGPNKPSVPQPDRHYRSTFEI